MSASLSKSLRLSSTLKIEEEAMVTKNQGIGSILGSDSERSKSSSSLRRTLSADMSSTKWLTQHGFSPMKKIASSKEFSVSSITDLSEEEDGDYEDKESETETDAEQQSQFDFWSSIQEEVYKKKELEKPGQFDIWSSIISQKSQDKSLPPPYIHPLVKRSASSLSTKSLEICTESLGSETGSDGFSSYPSSETGDTDDDKEIEQEKPLRQPRQQQKDKMAESFDDELVTVPKYNYIGGKKSAQRSFPPPIPSLSRHHGAAIRMQSRRDNGRLVLEAVSVPCTNNFRAQRQGGRLVLTFVDEFSTHEEKEVPMEEGDEDNKVDNFDEEGEEEEETEEEEHEESENENRASEMEIEFVVDQQAPKFSNQVINVHRLTLVMNKHLGLAKSNPTWPNKFNEVVKFNEVEEEIKPPSSSILVQSLPSPPSMARLIPKSPATAAAATVSSAAGATFNAYEYFWRPKPITTSGPGTVSKQMMNQQPQQQNSKFILAKNINSLEKKQQQQQVLLLSGNIGDNYLVPLTSKGCKEPRRSLLFWEPYCIATS